MARFTFRLQTLHVLREADRAARRAELAEALMREARLRERRQMLDDELAGARLPAGSGPGRVDIAQWQSAARHEESIRAQMTELAAQAQAIAREIAERRQAMVAADQEVRVLEKLRLRQFEEFQEREARGERKELDEAAARTVHSRRAS